MTDKIDVIVPVYNEENGIRQFVRRIQTIPLDYGLIFVDNASTDKTAEILQTLQGITLIRHERNEGYGASIRDGISHSSANVIVIIDADCEYPPESIPELVKGLERSDVVYASRFLKRERIQVPRLKLLGNRIITGIFNALFGQNITDLYTGCKALKRSALNGVTLNRNGFEHVLEMAVKLSKNGIRIDEIFVEYASRQTGYSKMRHISETLKFCFLVLWYRFVA